MLNFKSVNITACVIFIGLLVAYFSINLPIWCLVVFIVFWFLITIAGSTLIRWDYHFKSFNSNPNCSKNQVAITFDDGPHPEFTPQVLNLLAKYQAKATFFCIGKHMKTYPELLKKIIAQGHTIGNHTYSHANNFGFFNTEKVIEELQQTNRAAKHISGLDLQLYRPAFGVTNPRIKRAIKATDLQSIGWNKRSLDTTPLSEKTVINRITKTLKKGDVILLHDTSSKTVHVLEQLLLFLQQEHLESVTIDSLFNIKAYA